MSVMFKGFYQLTSGMLTQNRNLNVISNNMTNTMTPGFKRDKYVPITFQEEMMYRTGNKNKANPTALNNTSMILTEDDVYTDFKQGAFEETGNIFDFAINGDGFFQVQTEDGIVYTRNGSFVLDEEGYLTLPNVGQVLGAKGPILFDTDNIHTDPQGRIYAGDNDTFIDNFALVDFPDYTQLNKSGEGLYNANGQQPEPIQGSVLWKTVERSNVDMIEEMTSMMSSQRALQSASQVLKMYDQMMSKAVNDIGRI